MKFLYTDSIIGWFQTKDIKEDLKDPKLAPHFETLETEKVPRYMKIEKIGILMFHALCPKHYFYISNKNGKFMCNETFKGIPAYARKQSSHDELKKILESGVPPIQDHKKFSMQTIRSKKHETFVMHTVREPTDDDDKRCHLPSSYETLPWGHYRLQ
jgi:hypothetical protein